MYVSECVIQSANGTGKRKQRSRCECVYEEANNGLNSPLSSLLLPAFCHTGTTLPNSSKTSTTIATTSSWEPW